MDQDRVEELPPEQKSLIEASKEARENAYCPYSKFKVGSAVLCEDNSIFKGSNVENCSYGVSVCAERVAICKAVSEGKRSFKGIAVCGNSVGFTAPCGVCRQVLVEFGSQWDIFLVKPTGEMKKVDLASILPMAFSPESLREEAALSQDGQNN